jgi:hypothetical protein
LHFVPWKVEEVPCTIQKMLVSWIPHPMSSSTVLFNGFARLAQYWYPWPLQVFWSIGPLPDFLSAPLSSPGVQFNSLTMWYLSTYKIYFGTGTSTNPTRI